MSLGMHFFKVPTEKLLAKGFKQPRVDDTDFLNTIISCEEVGYLNSAWGIHIWLMNNGPTYPRRGDPFLLSEPMLQNLKNKLEQARDDAAIVATNAPDNPHNYVLEYKNSWRADNPAGLKKHFPYNFDNITAGDVMEGLRITNELLDSTDFSKDQIWYYPFY